MEKPKPDVGGQAVIEGVMMRSPTSFTVVCRRPDKSIVIREEPWQPVWANAKFLRWPVFRGGIVLLEAMVNGISALTFSSEQQQIGENAAASAPQPRSLGAAAAPGATPNKAGTYAMLAVSIAFGLALFVGAPHLAAWGLGTVFGFDSTSFVFHAVDGVIKLAILLGYMTAISFIPEIRRVFQYHGAEHKSIFTYEAGLPLTVEHARKQTRFHPRCGTSFLLIVVMVSIVIFSALLTYRISQNNMVDNLAKILIKIPLMFPVAGLSYEFIKFAGKKCETNALARALSAPGMWLQRITTKEPDDDQLEIALISIRKTLWREAQNRAAAEAVTGKPGKTVRSVEHFPTAGDIDLPLVA